MSKTVLPDPLTHIWEFVPKSSGGTWTGTCGETALAVAMGASKGFQVTPSFIDSITNEMISRGEAQTNGASRAVTLASYAKRHGYTFTVEQDDNADNWLDLARQYAGEKPIILVVTNGQALVDTETGAHDEPGLHNHVIAILGKQDNGYIVNDGDNPQVNSRFQIYTAQTIQAASPYAVLVMDMQRAKPAGGTGMLPVGWSDSANGQIGAPGATLTAPNGVTVIRGFRDWVLAHPDWLSTAGLPLVGEYQVSAVGMDPAHGAGSEQIFQFSGLGWYASTQEVVILWTGAMVQALRGQLDVANKQITQLQNQAGENVKCIAAVQAIKAALDTVP